MGRPLDHAVHKGEAIAGLPALSPSSTFWSKPSTFLFDTPFDIRFVCFFGFDCVNLSFFPQAGYT
jgi:hypothetical protein